VKLFFSILLTSFCFGLFAQQSAELSLASQYYRDGDCEKTISIYEELKRSKINIESYYSNYFNCLLQLNEFSQAEKLTKKLQKKRPNDPRYIANLGFVWEAKGLKKKAHKEFNKAIESLKPNQIHSVTSLANTFVNKGAYDWALKTYEHGQEVNPKHEFGFHMANTYKSMGKTEKMIDAYLQLVVRKPSHQQSVQTSLQNTLARTKGTGDNFDLLKQKLIKKIQKTNNTDLTEMLVWLFMQSDEFNAAFIYSKALDKRLNEDGTRLYTLATIAHENKAYDTAIKSYQYLIDQGRENTYYLEARILELIAQTEQTLETAHNKKDLRKLDDRFQKTFDELGKNTSTAYLIKEYAHLNGFYLNNPEKAISLLEKAILLTSFEAELQAECKLELADILLMTGDEWEAILLYSQVEKSLKEKPIGHEAKFRRARIAYFQGEMDWAQAQLDVLKASTSKLIANNAMNLSLLITDNMGLDTSAHAMQMYARAELLEFQNRLEESVLTLDSLSNQFSGHSLQDEIIFKKATIAVKQQDYEQAINLFEKVATNYAYDLLADDALFQWGKLTEEYLKDEEKAQSIYEQILVDHSDSIYTTEARKRFRALRGDTQNNEL
jgi:tetratricopeptide (TPR) repeat protein